MMKILIINAVNAVAVMSGTDYGNLVTVDTMTLNAYVTRADELGG